AAAVSSNAASPTYLAPGTYWLVLRNTHASNTFGLGTAAAGTLASNTAQEKTLGSALGSTLDFVAASWTKKTFLAGVRLNGLVFGGASAF
ncbi:MAG TPA: hypothetical protein VMU02_05835, partial [bacterium]|nr:hypothetical protein [bacterium]